MPYPTHHRRQTAYGFKYPFRAEWQRFQLSIPASVKGTTPNTLLPKNPLPMLLLTTILTLWLTALPCLRAMPTTPSSPLHRRTIRCHEIPRRMAAPLDIVDCIVALNSLPATEAMGGFGRNPTDQVGIFSLHADPATRFRLPRHFAHGTCMIGVTMATTGIIGDEDSESWNRITRKALAIINQCVQQPAPENKVGGIEYAGAHGRIQVEVFRAQRYLQFMVELNKPPAPGSMGPPPARPPRASS